VSDQYQNLTAEPRIESDDVFAPLRPPAFWRHFAALTTIPRPSHHEEQVADHVRKWAAARGFLARTDSSGNVVIQIPATSGRESTPAVILQGHLDMVCERQPDSPYDPAKGRIRVVREGEWITADGTTLGADDGVAIAAMMALADDASVPHGPLELLMTVAEEVGLAGAQALDGSLLTGSILLNLDSEEDGRLTIGCAGSTDTFARLDLPRVPVSADSIALRISVSGGKGGHSGNNIAQGRSNAVKVLGRALREVFAEVPFQVSSFDGGKSRNAIPRDAAATCVVASSQVDVFRRGVRSAAAVIREAYAATDAGVTITVDAVETPADAATVEATQRLLDAVALMPSGPLSMATDFEGLVEMSSSLGVAATEGGRVTLHSLTRTSNQALLPDVLGTLDAAARLAGGALEVKNGYPGWRPDLSSPVLALAESVYEQTFGKKPFVTAVHGGLEPAVIGGKVTRPLDMLSFGPQIDFPHSPDERVSIPSVERFWTFLVGLLDAISTRRAEP
jgi:dipeptidase D